LGTNYMATTKRGTTGSRDSVYHIESGVIVNNSETHYLKAHASTSITNLQVAYKISARRIS